MSRCGVVTGAARGIGLAVAERLLVEGWSVAMIDRDELVHAEAARLGSGARAYQADVAREDDWRVVMDTLRSDLGPVDGLVCNALASDPTPLHEMVPASWQRQLEVNLGGAFHGLRACLSDLRRQRDGRVVIVSSVHAFFGLADVPAYATTKAGLTGLSRQLAVQYAGEVRVNCVVPGPVLTAQWDRLSDVEREQSAAATVVGRLGRPAEVAAVIVFLLGDEASFMTGSTVTVDGGWSITKGSS